jgi:hypothetical protein
LVCRVCIVLFVVVLRGLMMMSRRLLVTICCERVVFCACADPRHDSYLMLYASGPMRRARCSLTRGKRTGAVTRAEPRFLL